MSHDLRPLALALGLCLLALAGCRGEDATTGGASDGASDEAAGGTRVSVFDPADWSTENASETSGSCRALRAMAAYECELEGGGVAMPCFPLEDGRLGCSPAPIPEPALRLLVTPSAALPPLGEPTGLAFLVQLDDGLPCGWRSEPILLDGQRLTYGCEAPGAWLSGALDRSDAVWTAQQVITDSSGASITSGPTTRQLLGAWTDG